MIRLSHFAPVALAASLMVGLSGCEADNDEPLAYESRDIRGDARNDVPTGATLMKQGHEPLLFQAPSDGSVWVYNSSDNRLVYSGAVRAGQTIHVDADHDFVTVDGRKVVDMKMDDFDNHQILFGPSTLIDPTARTRTPEPAQQPAQQPAPAGASITVEQQPATPPPVIIQPQPQQQPPPTEVQVNPGGQVEVQQPSGGVKVVPSE